MKKSLNDKLNEIIPPVAFYLGILGYIAMWIYEFVTKPL